MSRRMNWAKRRPTFEPWYARLDRDPFGREATNLVRHGVLPSVKRAKPAKPAKPKLPPIRTPLERPTAPAGALTRKYALRTGDPVRAREALACVTEAAVWSDGGCTKNPGIMGWGVVILVGNVRVELFGGGVHGTNNHAELRGAILALEALPEACRATIISDSTYVVNGASKWCRTWRQRDFKRNNADIPNADLWRKLDALAAGRSITWQWVRGHNGDTMNELADKLAALGRTGGRA